MDIDYSRLSPAVFDDKDIAGSDWIDGYLFTNCTGVYASNDECNTFLGFINGKYEVRIHFSANRLTIEFAHCNPPQEIVDAAVEFFGCCEDTYECRILCNHWREQNVLIFQYYHKN